MLSKSGEKRISFFDREKERFEKQPANGSPICQKKAQHFELWSSSTSFRQMPRFDITVYREATQNVMLQRLIRLVILCHHQLEYWELASVFPSKHTCIAIDLAAVLNKNLIRLLYSLVSIEIAEFDGSRNITASLPSFRYSSTFTLDFLTSHGPFERKFTRARGITIHSQRSLTKQFQDTTTFNLQLINV